MQSQRMSKHLLLNRFYLVSSFWKMSMTRDDVCKILVQLLARTEEMKDTLAEKEKKDQERSAKRNYTGQPVIGHRPSPVRKSLEKSAKIWSSASGGLV